MLLAYVDISDYYLLVLIRYLFLLQLEYYLLSYLEDYEDYFYLSEHQGHATIAIAQPLDRETMPYSINLFVSIPVN